MGFTAVRRAAAVGVGLLFDSMSTPERCRALTDAYRKAGGDRPCVLIRRAWLGEPPRGRLDDQLDVHRSYTPASVQRSWGDHEVAAATDPDDVASALVAATLRAGCDALNLRVHVPGVDPSEASDQITRLGSEVLPAIRSAVSWVTTTEKGTVP